MQTKTARIPEILNQRSKNVWWGWNGKKEAFIINQNIESLICV